MTHHIPTLLDELAWLEGDWIGEDPHETLEQHYSGVCGATIVATSREVRGGRSEHREFLLFEQEHDTLHLTVLHPKGSNDAYIWKGLDEVGSHVFESISPPGLRLSFLLVAPARMHIRFEKEKEGAPAVYDFHLVR
mgnify:CR=1 FL=1